MRHQRRGSQAIEFALLAPILLVLLSGIIDVSQYFWLTEGLVTAVAAGARAGAVLDPTLGDRLTTGKSSSTAAWAGAEMPGTPTFTAVYSGTKPNVLIVVQGVLPFSPWFGFIPLPRSINYTVRVRTAIQT